MASIRQIPDNFKMEGFQDTYHRVWDSVYAFVTESVPKTAEHIATTTAYTVRDKWAEYHMDHYMSFLPRDVGELRESVLDTLEYHPFRVLAALSFVVFLLLLMLVREAFFRVPRYSKDDEEAYRRSLLEKGRENEEKDDGSPETTT